ncbi:hypothetical protein [Actinomadura sp. NEAU-AAG7]|uniref:hypothetical protein n=1 Tax=Actinomadura sp. NEAU-AAG7 TaxID=2839640 RepID=UPI001BE3F633|nr:hypothetical protein [Actinomadura sp. NEAU-AAG7]MBT2211092.1 hypothetical protein [Actinomadura sp. NEAU-AAG7]
MTEEDEMTLNSAGEPGQGPSQGKSSSDLISALVAIIADAAGVVVAFKSDHDPIYIAAGLTLLLCGLGLCFRSALPNDSRKLIAPVLLVMVGAFLLGAFANNAIKKDTAASNSAPSTSPHPTASSQKKVTDYDLAVTKPENGDLVSTFTDVRIHSRALGPGLHVWVLTKFKATQRLYPQGECDNFDGSNFACNHVQFSDPGDNKSVMQVSAIIVDDRGNSILQRYKSGFDSKESPISAIQTSATITVKRK